MRKMIGIFLAVCFVLSVTAAAASAGGADNQFKKKVVNDGNTKSLKNDYGKHLHSWKNKFWMWIWVPGHYETKVIKMVKKVHHKKVVIKKVIKIWIPGHWELKIFKYNQGNNCIKC